MSTVGLIMAGGDGQRLRRSGLDEQKPLVRVRGRSLLEHAIQWQRNAGVTEIFVAVRADQDEILAHLDRIGTGQSGVTVSPLIETKPMGNAGALLALRGKHQRALLSFADNVSALDGSQLIDHHLRSCATATLAVHETTVPFPFGVVCVHAGRVERYEEKPPVRRLIASGYAVFELHPLEDLEVSGPFGVADVVTLLLERGNEIAAFRHEEAWVDVNDRSKLVAAEEITASVLR